MFVKGGPDSFQNGPWNLTKVFSTYSMKHPQHIAYYHIITLSWSKGQLRALPSQIAKTLEKTSIRYGSDTFVLDRYLIDIDLESFCFCCLGLVKLYMAIHWGTYMNWPLISPWTKWLPFRRRYFEDGIFRCILEKWKFCILIEISLKFVPKVLINNNPALV